MRKDKDAKHSLGLERPNKPSEEVLIERAVRTIIQILYDKGLFDIFDNANGVSRDYLFFEEVNERRRPQLQELKVVVVIQ